MVAMKTYDKIMESSYRLFLEKGFHEVSWADISEEAEISPGTLYYYFKTKDELILAVLDTYVLEYYYDFLNNAKKVKGSAYNRLKGFYRESLGLDKDYAPKYLSNQQTDYKKMLLLSFEGIQKYSQVSDNYNEYNKVYTQAIEDFVEFGKENGEINPELSTEELTLFIKSSINGVFFLWIVQDDLDVRHIVEVNVDSVWDYMKK